MLRVQPQFHQPIGVSRDFVIHPSKGTVTWNASNPSGKSCIASRNAVGSGRGDESSMHKSRKRIPCVIHYDSIRKPRCSGVLIDQQVDRRPVSGGGVHSAVVPTSIGFGSDHMNRR